MSPVRATILQACALSTCASVAVIACGAFGSSNVDDHPVTDDSGSPDAVFPLDAPVDVTTTSRPDAAPDGASDGACTAARGSQGVLAAGFCVDRTEVTWAQYFKFLSATAGSTGGQPAFCAFNATYDPTCNAPANAALPVTCVDWCDAYAYCAWAGKHLCGRVGGGGPVPVGDDGKDPTRDEWYAACATLANRTYPYGDTFEAAACNVDGGALATVGSFVGCVGGYAGVFDMSGNANEWEDSCTGDGGASDSCRCRGGSYESPNGSACADLTCGVARGSTYSDLGFRCCFEQ